MTEIMDQTRVLLFLSFISPAKSTLQTLERGSGERVNGGFNGFFVHSCRVGRLHTG